MSAYTYNKQGNMNYIFKDITYSNPIPIAYCLSHKCNKGRYIKKKGIEKPVALGTTTCPDCGYALLWRIVK